MKLFFDRLRTQEETAARFPRGPVARSLPRFLVDAPSQVIPRYMIEKQTNNGAGSLPGDSELKNND